MKKIIEKIYSIIYGDGSSLQESTDNSTPTFRQKAIVVFTTLALSITFLSLIIINILKKIESL